MARSALLSRLTHSLHAQIAPRSDFSDKERNFFLVASNFFKSYCRLRSRREDGVSGRARSWLHLNCASCELSVCSYRYLYLTWTGLPTVGGGRREVQNLVLNKSVRGVVSSVSSSPHDQRKNMPSCGSLHVALFLGQRDAVQRVRVREGCKGRSTRRAGVERWDTGS